MVIDDKVVAVLIDSTLLGAPIWFVLDDDWRPDPGDKTPVFYPSELPFLRTKTPQQLCEVLKLRASLAAERLNSNDRKQKI